MLPPARDRRLEACDDESPLDVLQAELRDVRAEALALQARLASVALALRDVLGQTAPPAPRRRRSIVRVHRRPGEAARF